MSVENVKKFHEALSKDEVLKQKFVELSQKYEGQPMDEEKALSVMEQEGLPLAAQMGYSFTMGDLKTYEQEMKHVYVNCELSEEELQTVAGGGATGSSWCSFIGVPSGDFSGFCFLFGVIRRSDVAQSQCILFGDLWTNL